MRTERLSATTHVEDRRITRANAGKVIRNGIRADEGYHPLPGNRMSNEDPRVVHAMESTRVDGIGNLIRRLNQRDTVPHSSPYAHEPSSRVGSGTRGTVPR